MVGIYHKTPGISDVVRIRFGLWLLMGFGIIIVGVCLISHRSEFKSRIILNEKTDQKLKTDYRMEIKRPHQITGLIVATIGAIFTVVWAIISAININYNLNLLYSPMMAFIGFIVIIKGIIIIWLKPRS
jgi:hypothetical protein